GLVTEGSFRSHQVPLAEVRSNPQHLAQLEAWLRSYRPEELFDARGALRPELVELAPAGGRRGGAKPHPHCGPRLRGLERPDFREYGVQVPAPGTGTSEATRVLGGFLRDVIVSNRKNFRIVGPDETASNRLTAVFECTDRTWEAETVPGDESLAPDGQVME